MKISYILGGLLLFTACGGQKTTEIGEITTFTAQERTIQVTGSADMQVEPDEIEFIIGIEEDMDYNLSLDKIEANVREELNKIGIKNEDITVNNVGNYWNYKYEKRVLSKTFSVQLETVDQIDELLQNMTMKGIAYMSIGELQHENLQDYRKQVKSEALLAAKEKAKYMVDALDKELGDVISIIEVNNSNNWWYYGGASLSNSTIPQPGGSSSSSQNNPRKISLRYEVITTFEIL